MPTMSELSRQYQEALEHQRRVGELFGDADELAEADAELADARAALEVGWCTWAAGRLAGRGGRR